jgi:hypothetical protein
MEESKKYTLRVDADLLEKLIEERMRQRVNEEMRFPYTILNLHQVAGLLKTSPHILSRWLNSEQPPKLPVIRIGSQERFVLEDVVKFIESSRGCPPPAGDATGATEATEQGAEGGEEV